MSRRLPPRAPTEDATVVRLVPVTGARRYDPDFDDEEGTDADAARGGGGGGSFDVGALLGPLDDRHGPARRLGNARMAGMVRSIADAAMAVNFAGGTDVDVSAADASRTGVGVRRDPDAEPTRVERGSHGERAADRAMADLGERRERQRGRRPVAVWAVAAMLMLVVSAAAAAVYVAVREPSPEPAPAAPAAPTPPAEKPRRVVTRPVVPPPVEELAVDELETDDAGEIEMLPLDEPTAGPVRRGSRSRGRDLAPADATPEDLLALANQARKDKRWRDADDLYRRVILDHVRSSAAQVATVSSADLHLDHLGDPAGALRLFRRALRVRPSGPLAEEARWGAAEALRALGDGDAEAEALRAFLAAHPDSARAASGRARLGELEPRR